MKWMKIFLFSIKILNSNFNIFNNFFTKKHLNYWITQCEGGQFNISTLHKHWKYFSPEESKESFWYLAKFNSNSKIYLRNECIWTIVITSTELWYIKIWKNVIWGECNSITFIERRLHRIEVRMQLDNDLLQHWKVFIILNTLIRIFQKYS